ncbi:MAG TPA: hypothetical protein VLE99_01015 [Candidatus Saccharimonadales bacterium]|nr:hypothetical protein [Candidatus Saccharimonadales bacterium]
MKAKYVTTLAALVGALSLGLVSSAAAAGSAAFSLSPASGTEDVNSTFNVGVYENGTSVNVVTVNFSYDTSDLQLVSVDTSASAFAADAGSTSTSLSRYVPAGGTVSGTQEVAVLKFKALTGTGAASVAVGNSGSHIASAGTEQWNGVAATGSYTLNTPAPVTPPSNPGNGGSTSAGNPTSKSTAPKTTTSTSSTTTPATTPPATTSSQNTATIPSKQMATTTPATESTSHAGLVTSTVLGVVIAGAAAYWLVMRKRTELAPAKVYKLDTAKKTPAKKKPATRSNAATKARTTTSAQKKTVAKKSK